MRIWSGRGSRRGGDRGERAETGGNIHWASGLRPTVACRLGLVVVATFVAFALGCGEPDVPATLGDHGPQKTTQEPESTALPSAASPHSPDGPDRAASATARDAYDRWVPLIAVGLIDEARSLCTSWIESPEPALRVEGHKCLANVTLKTTELPPSETLAPNATVLQPRNTPEGVETALAHYESALEIEPLDTDSHLGRIDALILAERYLEANAALEQTLETFDSREKLELWFKLLGRFRQLGKFEEGLAYLLVIEKHHPLDHRVVANLGAYYAVLGNYDEALEYAKKSVALNPEDPINQWNLGRLYDHQGQLELADASYLEALALFRDSDPHAACDYARFVASRLKDVARACDYARSACAEFFEQHCGQPPEES